MDASPLTRQGLRGFAVVIVAIYLMLGWLVQPAAAAPAVPVPAGGTLAVQTGQRSAVVYATVTVTGARKNGYLVVYTCGTTRPATSTMTFAAFTNAAITTAVLTDSGGSLCVFASSATHVVVDFAGLDPGKPTPTPARLLDTRTKTSPTAGRVMGDAQTVEFVAGPANATVFGTLTSVDSVRNGYVVLYTCGTPLPKVSSAIFTPGVTRATFAVARTDARGRLCLFSSAGTHVVYDRIKSTSSTAVVAPVRVLDTRATGAPGAGAIVRIPVSAPNNFTVWGTLTTTGGSANGYTTVFSCSSPPPTTSATQIVPGEVLTQLVSVRSDGSGAICVRVSAGTHVVFDQYALGIVTGTPNVRVMDTRTLTVPRHPGTGREFYPSVARWADQAAAALQFHGLSVDYLPGVLAQVQQESAGIPDAVNNWDSNWQRGIASFGLLQTIYPTFNFYAPTECRGPDVGTVVKGKRQQYHPNMVNPDCNIRSALAYVKRNYGPSLLDKWNQGINRGY